MGWLGKTCALKSLIEAKDIRGFFASIAQLSLGIHPALQHAEISSQSFAKAEALHHHVRSHPEEPSRALAMGSVRDGASGYTQHPTSPANAHLPCC